jgi:hypothetical protein
MIERHERQLAAWRNHRTTTELYTRARKDDFAANHRKLSRPTILKLANSRGLEDPPRSSAGPKHKHSILFREVLYLNSPAMKY